MYAWIFDEKHSSQFTVFGVNRGLLWTGSSMIYPLAVAADAMQGLLCCPRLSRLCVPDKMEILQSGCNKKRKKNRERWRERRLRSVTFCLSVVWIVQRGAGLWLMLMYAVWCWWGLLATDYLQRGVEGGWPGWLSYFSWYAGACAVQSVEEAGG